MVLLSWAAIHSQLDGERRRSDGLQEELKQAKTLAVNVVSSDSLAK